MLGRLRWQVNESGASSASLVQLRVLRLGFLQDGDVGVGVFPEGEEILVSRLGFGGIAGEDVGTGQANMR